MNMDAKGPDRERVEGEYPAPDYDPMAPLDTTEAQVVDENWVEPEADSGRLEFGDEEVRLPWLETDGDDEEQYQGYGAGQMIGLLVLGLMAVALIGGGIWWVLGQGKGNTLVADGSTIAAPKQPYKEAPKDPGGKTFAGTGDTSYAVSEGQTRPARLGQGAAPVAAAPAAPSATPEPTGIGVQLAAYANRAQAEDGWKRLSGQYEVLAGLNHRIVEGSADIGTVYRLQVLADDSSGAYALCGRLKGAGLACQVKN